MKISTKTSEFLPEVGDRLKVTRKAFGLSQEELAHLLGVTRGAIANWERGTRLADAAAMVRLCRAYRISMDWLYMGDMSQLPPPLEKVVLGKTQSRLEGSKQKHNIQNLVKFEP